MEEEWRDIPRYEGLYQVSNLGRVKILPKSWSTGSLGLIKMACGESVTEGGVSGGSYRSVGLRSAGERKHFKVHRLVAQVFIPNPENKPQVNHIDGNKLNNIAMNLEWCSEKENTEHAFKTGLRSGKKVRCNETGELFDSVKQAAKVLGVFATHISAMLKGRYKTVGGHTFSYIGDRDGQNTAQN